MHVPYWQKNQFQLHLPVMCLAALEYTRTVNSLPITCYKKARGRVLGGVALKLLPKIVQKERERVLFERRNACYAFWVAQMAKAGKGYAFLPGKKRKGTFFFRVLKRVKFHSRWYVKRV